MTTIKLASGKIIGGNNRPYFVAEVNSSHNGNIEIAKKMIDKAKECGCDAVKFQSWTADSLYSADYYKGNPIARRMIEKFSLSKEALIELASYCHGKEIAFSSTPYSSTEVDLLINVKADYIKIASMDLNNLIFLKYIGEKGFPVVLSTGMGTIEEIHRAIKTIEETGNRKICILHCVSVYPVKPENVNLNNIQMLKKEFPKYPVGYSDHTLGSEIACAATAMGAAMIEKHFTLDSSKIGWDNQMAVEPPEMKEMVEKCRNVYLSLGSFERTISDEEMGQREKMRRSIVANRQLEAGSIVSAENIDAKRPGTGIPPECYEQIVGKKISRKIEKNEMILRKDLRIC